MPVPVLALQGERARVSESLVALCPRVILTIRMTGMMVSPIPKIPGVQKGIVDALISVHVLSQPLVLPHQ